MIVGTKRIFTLIVLSLASTVVGLIIAEAAVSLTWYVMPAPSASYTFWEPHAVFGWANSPGKIGWHHMPSEFRVLVRINSKGLRDHEYAYSKPNGVRRVLVLGDSMVEAAQVPLEQSFTKLLESRLNLDGHGPKFEIVAAGVGGWSTGNQLLYFLAEGHRYEPDLVLLAFCTCNDPLENSHTLSLGLYNYGRGPFFHRTPDGLALDYLSTEVSTGATTRRMKPVKALLRQLALYRLAQTTLVSRAPSVAEALRKVGLVSPDLNRRRYDVYSQPYTSEWEEAWEVTKALVVRLKREVNERHAEFAVVVLTNPEQVHPEIWAEILARHRLSNRELDLDKPERRVTEFLRAEDIPFIALLPIFLDHVHNTGEQLHFRFDGHWNAAGHRLAAETVHRFLAGRLR